MKTFRAKLKIWQTPKKITDIRLLPSGERKIKKLPGYIDRKEIREIIINRDIYDACETGRIEKTGCGRIILNQCEISPCSGLRSILSEKESDKIIMGLELFMVAFGSEVGVVCLPKKNRKILNSMLPLVQKTPNVYERLIQDRYPLGIEEVFARWYLRQKKDYFPGKDGTLIVTPEKCLNLYNYTMALDEAPLASTICVLNGDNVCYVRAESNMTVKTLLERLEISSTGLIIEGDPLNGRTVNPGKKISDKNVISVLPLNSVSLLQCCGCGICVEVCPVQRRVPRSKKILNFGGGMVPPEQYSGCVNCGLCGYFCPARTDK